MGYLLSMLLVNLQNLMVGPYCRRCCIPESGRGEIKLELTRKFRSYWLAFIVLGGHQKHHQKRKVVIRLTQLGTLQATVTIGLVISPTGATVV